MKKHPTNMQLQADLFDSLSNDQYVQRDQALALETLRGHIENLQDRLGLRDHQIAEVLQDLCEWYSTDVTYTTL